MDWFPLLLSLRVAALATVAALVVGVPLAWWLARLRPPLHDVLAALVTLPMLLPPTVLGYYLLLLVGRTSPLGMLLESTLGLTFVFSWPGAVLASFVAAMPFLVRTAQAGFEALDPVYVQAARTLGRSELAIFFHVTVPLAWRSIVAGTALCFGRAIGEFGATIMLAGNIPGRTQTMPVAIYDAVQALRYEQANTLALTLTLVAVGLLVLLGTASRQTRW